MLGRFLLVRTAASIRLLKSTYKLFNDAFVRSCPPPTHLRMFFLIEERLQTHISTHLHAANGCDFGRRPSHGASVATYTYIGALDQSLASHRELDPSVRKRGQLLLAVQSSSRDWDECVWEGDGESTAVTSPSDARARHKSRCASSGAPQDVPPAAASRDQHCTTVQRAARPCHVEPCGTFL